MIDGLLKCIDILLQFIKFSRESRQTFFENLLRPLFAEMEKIHIDYAQSWAKIHTILPPEWEQGTPAYQAQLAKASYALLELREALKIPREKLQAALRGYDTTKLAKPEREFVEALVTYFPRGEIDSNDLPEAIHQTLAPHSTDYSLVSMQFYKALSGGAQIELHGIIKRTEERETHAWQNVCRTFSALQVYVFRGT